MGDSEKLGKEVKEAFEKTKKELKFKATFEEIEKNFYLTENIIKEGFVSEKFFARQLCGRMLDIYTSWIGTLHNFLIPNPQDLISLTECKKLSDEGKKEVSKMISIAMNLVRKNSLIAVSHDKSSEGKLIDEIVDTWKNKFSPGLIKILKKIQPGWEEASLKDTKN